MENSLMRESELWSLILTTEPVESMRYANPTRHRPIGKNRSAAKQSLSQWLLPKEDIKNGEESLLASIAL